MSNHIRLVVLMILLMTSKAPLFAEFELTGGTLPDWLGMQHFVVLLEQHRILEAIPTGKTLILAIAVHILVVLFHVLLIGTPLATQFTFGKFDLYPRLAIRGQGEKKI